MALAPPYDIIVQKAPVALSLLETQLFKLTGKLSEKVSEALMGCDIIPKNVSCSDPRVIKIKQIFEQIQTIIQRIADVIKIINVVYGICIAVAGAAYAYTAFRLTVLVPSVPADIETIEAQKQLAANIITALKKIGIVLGVVNVQVQITLGLLGGAINFISSICYDEEFVVFSATQAAIDLTAGIDLELINGIPKSKFYQTINVSDEDIKSRLDAANILLAQQRSLLDLLEAPSRVIIINGNNTPGNSLGKAGDYAINNQTKTIYGPKPSDTEWNEGIKY